MIFEGQKITGFEWLKAHVGYTGDGCLIWPLSHGHTHGYGIVSVNHRPYRASRVMCELVHGPAPSTEHQAAHSCGKGHEGCVHPQHLSWKTVIENRADSVAHGTATGGRRLSKVQVAKIKELLLAGEKSQAAIAEMFGVRHETISKIYRGATWRDPGQEAPPQRGPRPEADEVQATWHALETSLAVGDCWRFEDGETCTIREFTHDGLGAAVICASGLRYPVAALVRSADKVA